MMKFNIDDEVTYHVIRQYKLGMYNILHHKIVKY